MTMWLLVVMTWHMPVLSGTSGRVVSSDYNEHMLELRPNWPRSERQSTGLLKDYCHNVIADVSLPQQLSAQMKTPVAAYWSRFTMAIHAPLRNNVSRGA